MSKLAQALIEKEKEEKTGYLDLGRCGLTEVPDLSGMDWLETLILSNEWWDAEKRDWVESQNRWKPNLLITIKRGSLPLSLTKIVLGGYWKDNWTIKDWGFLDDLSKLHTLYLSYNNIEDCRFLKKMNNLHTLYLSNNNIVDIDFLENLDNIHTLNLNSNAILDWNVLRKLSKLHTLCLGNNNIRDIFFLEKLINLQILELSNNNITNAWLLGKLINLETLDISNNNIDDGDFLTKLIKLQTLDLSLNKIKDWSFLEKLTNLQTLDISSNGIEDSRFLGKLISLRRLYLSYNRINNLQFLEKMIDLQTLDISNNNISEIYFLGQLNNLYTLDLSNNYIKNWLFLENLVSLKTIDLSNNNIKDVDFLKKMINLRAIYLSNNEISDLSFLKKLINLNTLYLNNNNINDANFLGKLIKLQTLSLIKNNIRDICFLEKLADLTKIDLQGNHLTDISLLIHFFQEKELKIVWKEWYNVNYWQINVKDNPLENPPPEIIKQGNAAILEYFRQKEKSGVSLLNEAKLILLGDGRAGKTSLANRMLNKELPKEADRTQGVDIIIGEHAFPLTNGAEFKLHIWDFAGQDKYKPLHQFFYTEGAVYVLVADSGNAGTDFDDWFQTAQLFGTGSPVLVALNEFRDGVGFGTYDPEHWQKRFPGLLKEHFLVNLKTQKNFEPLKKAIHFQAQNLPHTQVEYPKNWAAVRQELERRRDENFISIKEYLNICKANDLPEKESALVLSGVLHRIGVCLHYQQSPLLRQHVILKNEWATEAVYRILEDQVVAEDKKGFFNWEDLKRIWSDEAYCDMQPQLLELMQQFKMAYPLPNSQEYVAPPLLPPAPPQGWEFPAGQALELFVEYEFLPKALLTQFIVSRHTDIDEGRTLVWRNGVVLRWPDALAQVEKTKSQGRDAFSVRCQGHNRKGLLTAILKTFRDLHSEYKGIKVTEVVPCPCSGCRSGQNKQHYFEFENLKNRLEKGRRVVECDKSLEEVELVRLLGDLLLFEHLAPGQPVVMSQNVGEQAPLKEQIVAPLAYFAYAPEDSAYFAAFQKQLHPLVRSGKIQLWDNSKIQAGEETDFAIQKNLQKAEIIFLLLSPDFLSVEAIWELEMKTAIKRHEAGTARVIPIKVRSCLWEDTPFGKLQGLPRQEIFISNSIDQDEAWGEVVKEIKGIIEEWNKNKKLP